MRRNLILLPALLLLGGAGAIAWTLLGWPPPRLVLKYGLTPGCEPTGRVADVEGIEFVEIGPGCFPMGSHVRCGTGDLLGRLSAFAGFEWGTPPSHDSDECPVHWVEFEQGFWISRYEITNEQYERFRPGRARPKYTRIWRRPEGKDPVVGVSWGEAREYCRWIGRESGLPVRLPSEAEWECSCRAGDKREEPLDRPNSYWLEVAWLFENSQRGATRVGTRRANDWGISDLFGNVSEWCGDLYHLTYTGAPSDGTAREDGSPSADRSDGFRVVRGEAWDSPPGRYGPQCRYAERWRRGPESRRKGLGFRPAFSLLPDMKHVIEPHLMYHRVYHH